MISYSVISHYYMKVLAIIPARGGSKRIPNKNIRDFCGKPLIAYAIEQAKASPFVNRYIGETNAKEIGDNEKKYGGEVPFLPPPHLATDSAQVVDSILHLLEQLKKEESYEPTHVLILQTTSPLREQRDIKACFGMMQKTSATTVLTVTPTHPRLYHLKKDGSLVLGNKFSDDSTNVQAWRPAYLLNGCFVYLMKASALRKERTIITKNTKAVVCDKWRSVDLDEPEDWVVAEMLYRHKKEIEDSIRKLT